MWYWHERVENCAAGCVNLPSAPAEFHHFEFSSCILHATHDTPSSQGRSGSAGGFIDFKAREWVWVWVQGGGGGAAEAHETPLILKLFHEPDWASQWVWHEWIKAPLPALLKVVVEFILVSKSSM